MSYIGETMLASIIALAIVVVMILVIVGFACLYYGAILFVLLTILKWFGIIGLVVVM
jgi:hypothetical protein